MKKILIILLTLCLLAVLSACDTGKNSENTSLQSESSDISESTKTDSSDVSSEPTTVPEEDVVEPIYANQLKDGSYEITVDSSSSMFRVIHCELIVENGSMEATMTMSGDGYGMVYMGTGEEALLDSEENYVPFVLDDAGAKNFTVPVEALDMELDCAAWSIRKEKWYDRTLIFQSAELPSDALIAE